MPCDPDILAHLDPLLAAIRAYPDPRRASDEWKQVYRLLQKTSLPSARVNPIVGMRDVAQLAGLIEELRSPAPAPEPTGEVPDAETLKQALKAFRKRLALTKLDEESKLGHSPLSKGVDSHAVSAMTLPPEWPREVWLELVRQGKLKHLGHGLYELGHP